MRTWNVRAEGETGRAPDLGEARQALGLIIDPASTVELMSLFPVRYSHLPGNNLDALVSDLEAHQGSIGNYVAVNPLPPGFSPEEQGKGAHVPDFTARRWLMVDVDPVKPAKDVNPTALEHAAAREVMAEVIAFLTGKGWPDPILIASGGWQALYRVDLPNDDISRTILGRVLKGLDGAFSGTLAKVDRDTHKATIHARIPGTWNRKGPHSDERPHRLVRLARIPAEQGVVSLEQLQDVAGIAPEAPPRPKKMRVRAHGSGDVREQAYARSALERECAAVAGCRESRNEQLNASAFALGQLVGGGLLVRGEVEEQLFEAGCACGLNTDTGGERGVRATIKSGLDAGEKEPRGAPEAAPQPSRNGRAHHPARDANSLPNISADDVATIDDLIAAGSAVEWLWQDWLPIGVLTGLAALGGTGKTRFCADLVRRIRHQLDWPDGSVMTASANAIALWVVADNHHDQMVEIAQAFDIKDNLRINASKADPFGGVSLETADDYAALESRIRAVRPALVIIDTVGNATDLNLNRQEDAKAFYQPLQILARRYRTAILCLTHLNTSGHFLGRRVLEKVRVALRIEQPEGQEKCRLEVHKSFSKRPPVLGMMMGDCGLTYDDNPPDRPTMEPGAKPIGAKLQECVDWLKDQLTPGPQRVKLTRDKAELKGFPSGTLYRAKDVLHVVESESQGYKWWALTPDEYES